MICRNRIKLLITHAALPRNAPARIIAWLRVTMVLLTVYLMIHNGRLVSLYMIH